MEAKDAVHTLLIEIAASKKVAFTAAKALKDAVAG